MRRRRLEGFPLVSEWGDKNIHGKQGFGILTGAVVSHVEYAVFALVVSPVCTG